MCGGGGDECGAGKGAGGDDFYTARIIALIKNGGQRRPTATVRPHPRNNQSIQQSTNVLCDGY